MSEPFAFEYPTEVVHQPVSERVAMQVEIKRLREELTDAAEAYQQGFEAAIAMAAAWHDAQAATMTKQIRLESECPRSGSRERIADSAFCRNTHINAANTLRAMEMPV